MLLHINLEPKLLSDLFLLLTCALVLQTFPVVSLLTDAVVLASVCAALTAGHQVAAVSARFTQRRAAGQILLYVAPRREVCG